MSNRHSAFTCDRLLIGPVVSLDCPLPKLLRDPTTALSLAGASRDVTFMCRRGNDSLIAARALRRHLAGEEGGSGIQVGDIRGGLQAWSREVDVEMPIN